MHLVNEYHNEDGDRSISVYNTGRLYVAKYYKNNHLVKEEEVCEDALVEMSLVFSQWVLDNLR